MHSLKSRYSGIEENKKLSLATILDPRLKDKFFSGNIIRATIKDMLVEEMPTFTVDVQNTELEGPTKPKRLCPLNSSVLLDVFSEIVAESNEDQPVPTSEVERYLGMPIIDFKAGYPFLWWSQHGQEFPILTSPVHFICTSHLSIELSDTAISVSRSILCLIFTI